MLAGGLANGRAFRVDEDMAFLDFKAIESHKEIGPVGLSAISGRFTVNPTTRRALG